MLWPREGQQTVGRRWNKDNPRTNIGVESEKGFGCQRSSEEALLREREMAVKQGKMLQLQPIGSPAAQTAAP